MSPAAHKSSNDAPHLPVLIDAILDHVPAAGTWIDATFGAGGYTRAFLDAGAERVIAIDRDPHAFELAQSWAEAYGDKLVQRRGTFSDMAALCGDFLPVDGVVLDLGVSSMQLDQPERGFSFQKDGPLDMRMGQDGASAADLVNEASEPLLADILFQYGEERASRRIARAIIAARPITTTLELAHVIETCLPKQKPGHSHPATRSFQAIRIAVNDEFGELIKGLEAAEHVLKPDGHLAVVTFHSLEDRIVKKFIADRAGKSGGGSRYAPAQDAEPASLTPVTRRAVTADEDELSRNPRARSAKLRVAKRLDAPARTGRTGLGLPKLVGKDLL